VNGSFKTGAKVTTPFFRLRPFKAVIIMTNGVAARPSERSYAVIDALVGEERLRPPVETLNVKGNETLLGRYRTTKSNLIFDIARTRDAPAATQNLDKGAMSVADMCKAAVELSDNTCANALLSPGSRAGCWVARPGTIGCVPACPRTGGSAIRPATTARMAAATSR
jgi:hypothetical protein